jgi:hypothetical protein
MTRRTVGCIVTLALSLLVAPLAAQAQPPAKVVRLGILAAGSYGPDRVRNLEAFRQRLRELGRVEGENLTMEFFQTHKVGLKTFQAALDQFGAQHLTELTALMGHYAQTAFFLNAFDVQLPEQRTELVLPV